jgi:hypothetical protein
MRLSTGFLLGSALVPLGLLVAPAPGMARTASEPSQASGTEVSADWLRDEEGRAYRIEPLPKSQAVKIAEDRVRTLWGVPADLAREDEQFFYIKLYRVDPPVARPRPAPAATGEDAETYPVPSSKVRFTSVSTGLPTAGQWRDGIALADLDGNGRPDIVTGPARKTLGPPAIFLSGETGWRRWSDAQFPSRSYDYGDIAVGRIDGDAIPDLVLGLHLRGMAALRGLGEGRFEDASGGLPSLTKADEPVFSSRALALADCNADGRLDVVALGEGPRPMTPGASGHVASGLAVFTRQADGRWTSTRQGEREGLFGADLVTADVDGDRQADVVIASGTFDDERIWYRGGGACAFSPTAVEAIRGRSYTTAVAAGDFNRDRRDEIVVGYTQFETDTPAFGVDVVTLAADGGWSRRALVREQGRARVEAIGAGDIDGDGHLDVAASVADGEVLVFLGDGRGAFTRESDTIESPGGCAASALQIGDLDGDGLGDLVIAYAQETSPSAPGRCPGEGGLAAWRTQRR